MTSYEPQPSSAPTTPSKPPINLLRGWPHPSLLPTSLIRSAAQEALSDPAISTPGLLYGPDPGYQQLRESIARWLTDFYRPSTTNDNDGEEEERVKGRVEAERVVITGGASQNLGSVLSVYTDPGYTRCVWVVAPAYFLAFRIFEDVGLDMRAVPEDEEGVDVEYLRKEMEKCDRKAEEAGKKEAKFKKGRPWAKVYKHVIYCVPTFANPSSRTTTLQRRRDLVILAREMDALVISDDVYDFLQWRVSPTTTTSTSPSTAETLRTAHLPRLVDLDRSISGGSKHGFGNTCSNGSFSKIAGPGIRVGWCEGSPKFAYGVSQVGTTKSGGAPSQLTSTYINIMLERGQLQRHIREVLVPAYQRRWGELVGAIEDHLVPLGFRLPEHNTAMKEVAGGYFTWLTLPSSLTSTSSTISESSTIDSPSPAETLAQRCLAEENVTIAPGKIFEVPGDHGNDHPGINFGNCIRLCWSWEDEEKLAEGVERIGRVARAMIREGEKLEEVAIRKGYVLVENKRQHERN